MATHPDALPTAAAAQPMATATCPLCGGPNGCAPAASGSFASPCWCTQAAIDPAALAAIPAALKNRACLCPRCAAGKMPRDAGAPAGSAN
jgi:hypothetical protein